MGFIFSSVCQTEVQAFSAVAKVNVGHVAIVVAIAIVVVGRLPTTKLCAFL